MSLGSDSFVRHPRSSSNGPPRIPEYHLLRVIGSGSYGEVWLAQSLTGALRAIKIISRKPSSDDRSFEREFAGLKRFEPISHRHPGWVRILHVGRNERKGLFYYVMEAADDCTRGQEIVAADYSPRTLSSELERRGRLPVRECISLGISLTEAVEAMHRYGLAHRDLKPSNVIFVNGEPKLADIGLVSQLGENATSMPGTEGYFPREGSGSVSADVFSLGRILYTVWTDLDAVRFPELPADLEQASDGLMRKFNELILKACEELPCDRLRSAQAMNESLRELVSEPNVKRPRPFETSVPKSTAQVSAERCVVILGHACGAQNQRLSALLQKDLSRNGWPVSLDKHNTVGIEWAWQVESKAAEADAVVALLSPESIESEMLAYELESARDASVRKGKPIVIPVRIQYSDALPGTLSGVLNGSRCLQWESPEDDQKITSELLDALASPEAWRPIESATRFEPPWGAMPLSSAFYVQRPVDNEFRSAIARRDSIVLVRGARQMGKSSLLARGLHEARSQGVLVVLTDFQALSSSDFETLERFYHALGNSIAEQLDLDTTVADMWDSRRSPNMNFDRFLRREVFEKLDAQTLWGLDEVDRLFNCRFGTEVFGMFRSWHNKRALDPEGPWANLTLAIAYATEAHLFITDLNQSPFNVGTPLTLEDFAEQQVADLNRRYGSPLREEGELKAFFRLVNGHPFLVRRGLHELSTRQIGFQALEAQASRDEGIFGDHLRRILVSLARDPALVEVVRGLLRGNGRLAPDNFYRLRAAGVVGGETAGEAKVRCQVYADFLRRHLL